MKILKIFLIISLMVLVGCANQTGDDNGSSDGGSGVQTESSLDKALKYFDVAVDTSTKGIESLVFSSKENKYVGFKMWTKIEGENAATVEGYGIEEGDMLFLMNGYSETYLTKSKQVLTTFTDATPTDFEQKMADVLESVSLTIEDIKEAFEEAYDSGDYVGNVVGGITKYYNEVVVNDDSFVVTLKTINYALAKTYGEDILITFDVQNKTDRTVELKCGRFAIDNIDIDSQMYSMAQEVGPGELVDCELSLQIPNAYEDMTAIGDELEITLNIHDGQDLSLENDYDFAVTLK